MNMLNVARRSKACDFHIHEYARGGATEQGLSISKNMLEVVRRSKSRDFFYASSACVYNKAKQEDPQNPGLIESDAWPARPQDTYGLEKLYAKEMALAYGRDFPINIHIARFRNIYGPHQPGIEGDGGNE